MGALPTAASRAVPPIIGAVGNASTFTGEGEKVVGTARVQLPAMAGARCQKTLMHLESSPICVDCKYMDCPVTCGKK